MIDIEFKYYLGILAIILSFVAIIPYVASILRNETKPHAFSWVIWGISTFTIFLAQFVSGGGAGSWSIGVSGVITIAIAILAYCKKSDYSITKMDWLCLVVALTALPCWYLTSNPLYAVVILTTIDIIGYLPTLRKSYHRPHEESVRLFAIMACRNVISIIALEAYILTNIIFQAVTMAANMVVIGLILIRRYMIKKNN